MDDVAYVEVVEAGELLGGRDTAPWSISRDCWMERERRS